MIGVTNKDVDHRTLKPCQRRLHLPANLHLPAKLSGV
jgi:hypothetical protein